MKKFLLPGVVIIVVAGAAGFYLFKSGSLRPGSSGNVTRSMHDLTDGKNIQEYHVAGTVMGVLGNKVSITAPVVENGTTVSKAMVATISDSTQVVTKVTDNKETYGSIKDISLGRTIDLTTTAYPYDQTEISPIKVVILQ